MATTRRKKESKMYSQFIVNGNDWKFSGPVSTSTKLDAGIYTLERDMEGIIHMIGQEIATEKLLPLPGSPVDTILQKIEGFMTDNVRNKFREYGLLYKRGILLYGPPGTGKTSVTNQVIKMAVEQKDMIVLLNPIARIVKEIVHNVRGIEGTDRPFMVVWEEFEDSIYDDEAGILNLLDGVNQVDNIVYLATTNYINKIAPRIKNRPSRFADVLEIGLPDADIRRLFLEKKAKDMKVEISLDQWIPATEGYSIDHMKDLMISVFILGIGFEDATERMKPLLGAPLEEDDEE